VHVKPKLAAMPGETIKGMKAIGGAYLFLGIFVLAGTRDLLARGSYSCRTSTTFNRHSVHQAPGNG
jgi:hypothetical protein